MLLARKIHLRENEDILEIAHQSIITYFWQYLVGVLLMIGMSFFTFWLFAQGWWGYALYGFGMLLGVFIIFRAWFFANKNLMVITSERVIDISRNSWFDEIISSASYKDIKDIFVRRRGILANIFNYGNLTVETKSEQVLLELERTAHPLRLQGIIVDAGERYRRQRNLSNRQAVYDSFIKIIPNLNIEEIEEIRHLLNETQKEITEMEQS